MSKDDWLACVLVGGISLAFLMFFGVGVAWDLAVGLTVGMILIVATSSIAFWLLWLMHHGDVLRRRLK